MLLNIEAERAKLQLTKREMCSALGVTTKTYLSYIRDGNPPTSKLMIMKTMFGCSVDYLLGLSESRNIAS